MIDIKIDRTDAKPIAPGANFTYVAQGNYHTLELSESLEIYSDSATSCIITIVVSLKNSVNSVTLGHLDSPACIEAFFEAVTALDAESYQIVAQGANPPDSKDAKENAEQIHKSIFGLGTLVVSQNLFLLEGDPREKNRGEFGLIYTADDKGTITTTATNQPYKLSLSQRDPSCGAQTVYCIMRRREVPPIQIRNAAIPFTHAELVELSSIALQYRKDASDPATAFTNIVTLESEEILKNWSSTPDFEPVWFSDQLKLGATFAIAMAPVVTLSEQHLIKTNEPTFARMRQALLD